MQTVLPIDNTELTVTRKVAGVIAQQLAAYTEMGTSEIIFDEGEGKSKNATPNSGGDLKVKLGQGTLLLCRYQEMPREDILDTPNFNLKDGIQIFSDPALGVEANTISTRSRIELNFKYRTRSRKTAEIWLNKFRRVNNRRKPTHTHDVDFTIAIPELISGYLYDLYELTKDNIAETSLKQYLDNHATSGLASRSNLIQTANTAVVVTRLTGCMGYYDEIPEEIESDTEKSIHQINFRYVFYYDKPTDVLFEYQKYLHNQTVNSQYLTAFKRETHHTQPSVRTINSNVITHAETLAQIAAFKNLEHTFFTEDTWTYKGSETGYTQMLQVPVIVDTNNPTVIFNINDIPDDNLSVGVKEELAFWRDGLTVTRCTPYRIVLYEVGAETTPVGVTIDDDLNITSTVDLDFTKRYYLIFELLHNLKILDYDGKKRMQENPDRALQVFNHLDPTITEVPTIGNGSFIASDVLRSIIESIVKNNSAYIDGGTTHRYYVMHTTVEV